jgi:hypothetical protein
MIEWLQDNTDGPYIDRVGVLGLEEKVWSYEAQRAYFVSTWRVLTLFAQ